MLLAHRHCRSPPCAARQLHGGRTGVEGPGLSASQRLAFGLGYVVLPYALARASRLAMEREWGARWVTVVWVVAGCSTGSWRRPGRWRMSRNACVWLGGSPCAVTACAQKAPQPCYVLVPCTPRSGDAGLRGGGRGGLWRVLRWLEGAYKAAALANLWLLLWEGKYRWAAAAGP